MTSLAANIIREKTACFFISPHLDDAVLSAGGLICQLAGRVRVKVLTVFTAASAPPHGRFARNALRGAGYADMAGYYRARRAEDRAAMGKLGVGYLHLGFVEAAQRKLANIGALRRRIGRFAPEVLYKYPSGHHIFSGRPIQEEKLGEKIKRKLQANVGEEKFLVFAPLGIGGHVDHILVRDICSRVFSAVIYWSDFPYNYQTRFMDKIDYAFIQQQKLQEFSWSKGLTKKKKLILGYTTELKSLFPNGKILIMPERYYQLK